VEKKLERLRWKRMWVSHLGCIKGCLDYLHVNVSDAWLFGATGHAFILNMHEIVCPSSPTAWNTQMLFRLGKNVGYVTNGIYSTKSDSDFAEKQKRAWDNTKHAIDHDLPCYGWELDIPEFYVVYGYDDIGYYFSGPLCDSGKGPKPWKKLGDSQIGVLEMCTVKPGKAADDTITVKQALAFALEHAQSPAKWIFPKYKAGLDGYDNWIGALEIGAAHGVGMAYNAAVWSECRRFAVEFLHESRARLNHDLHALFDEAIMHYNVVAQNLNKVAEAFPFHARKPEHIEDKSRRRTALECLRAARTAEEAGLITLEQIQQRL
jgi:hypothetical protein